MPARQDNKDRLKTLPDSYLRCMSEADRKALGRAGQTAAETVRKGIAKTEKELQRQIVSLLRLKGIEVNVSRMDKRKTDKVGWPDLTFAVYNYDNDARSMPWACAWEVKLPGRDLDEEQRKMKERMTTAPNDWNFRVIHSVDQAIEELRIMGIMGPH